MLNFLLIFANASSYGFLTYYVMTNWLGLSYSMSVMAAVFVALR